MEITTISVKPSVAKKFKMLKLELSKGSSDTLEEIVDTYNMLMEKRNLQMLKVKSKPL